MSGRILRATLAENDPTMLNVTNSELGGKLAIKNASKMGITGVHDAWQDQLTVESIIELIDYFNKNFQKYLYEIIIVYHPNSKKECLDILNK